MLIWSPIVLVLLGLLAARIAKARRVWRRHGLFTVRFGIVVLAAYTLFSLAVLMDLPRLGPFYDLVGAESGTSWFVGSGLLTNDVRWPVADPRIMAIVIVSFMLYPFWYWFGVNAGRWLFGRSPKQTGILGLLR